MISWPVCALAVTEGDAVVPVASKIQDRFAFVVATQDWHPPNHLSFAANHPGKKVYDEVMLNGLRQTLWPVHCKAALFNTTQYYGTRIFVRGLANAA
jgi:nicotinamidase/pyrazinamidase